MAERNVAVRLSANVNSYVAAMAKAKAATTGLSDSSSSLTRLGGAMQSVGRTATVGVTLPLLAVGAGAVSMAAKFDTAFAQMQGLANVPAAEIDGLKESVLSLAGETAVAPQELAEGLYFAASAGLDAASAMDAVALAAKASAAGMGTTQDVVGLVASAVASYGEANITAAQATDILTSTIREGRAEPAELASTLGRVLPIAADLGVSFDDVGASVALLTNVFGDTNRSVTAFQGMLVKLQSPSRQGRAALEEFGLSVGQIRQAISEDGLLGAFRLLTESGITDNAQAFAALFDDIEGRQGALALLNTDAETLNSTFEALDNSAGSLDTAFDAVSDTAGFKMKQAMTDIKVAMIQVGDVLLPIASDIATSISGLIGWFTDLNPAVQSVVVAVAGLAAAAGPAVFVAGSLIKNWQTVSGVFKTAEGATSKLGKAAGTLGLIGIAAGAAYLAFKFFTRSQELATAHIDTASTALETETVAVYNAAVAAGQATTQVDALAIAHLALSNAISEAADPQLEAALGALNITTEETLDVLTRLGSGSLPTIQAEMDSLTASYFGVDDATAHYINTLRGQGTSHQFMAALLHTDVAAIDEWDNALRTTTTYADQNKDEIDALALTYLNLQSRTPGVAHDTLALAESFVGSRFEAGNAIPVYEEYVRQVLALPPAQRDAIMTTDEFVGTINELIPGLDGATGATQDLGEAAMVAASSIDTTSRSMDYWDDVNHILGEYSSALDTALGHGGAWVRQHYDMAKAFREFSDGITDGEGEIDLLTQGIDANTEAGGENAGTILDMADQIVAMTKANLEAGKSQEETNAEYQAARTGLLDAAEAAGLNRGQVEDLIDTYGLVPDLVTTEMQIANDALMKWRIDRYLEKLDEIDPVIATQLEAAIDAGDWAEANRIMNELAAPRTAIVNVFANPIGFGGLTGRGWASHALGAYIPQPEIAMLHGNEAVLPLGNAARMRQLVADPRIGDPLMAAMSQVGSGVSAAMSNLMPYYSAAPGTAVSGGDTINVTVHNNGRDLSGDEIARAIDRHRVRR